MATYNVHEAKSQLSKLIDAVERGEEVIIARAGKPVAMLGPISARRSPRVRGLLEGHPLLGPEFDEPLPADIVNAFNGVA